MSERNKLHIAVTFLFTLISCVGLFVIADITSAQTLNSAIKEQVGSLIKSIQNEVNAYNYSNFATIRIASTLPIIKDPNVSIKEKAEQLFGVKDADSNLIGLNITDLQGNSYLVEGPMYNFSERAYFKNAIQGKETIFGPIFNKVTNLPTIFYGAPLYDDEGTLINTFFLAAHGKTLTEICSHNVIGTDATTIIIRRSTGLVIADINSENILNANIFDDAADSGSKDLQDITTNIALGQSGFSIIKMPNTEKQVVGYAPIENTDWSVIVMANYSDFTNKTAGHRHLIMIIFSAIMLLLSFIVPAIISKKDDLQQ